MPTFYERQAGIYRCRFMGTRDVEFDDQQTGEKVYRWDWLFQEINDPTTVGEISRLTSRVTSKASNAYKFWAGIKGGPVVVGDKTEDLVGTLCDVVYGPNQAGNLSITSVMRAPDSAPPVPQVSQVAPAPTTAPTTVEDDLPF